jgi:hypothetical protein
MQGAQFCNSDKSLLEIKILHWKKPFQSALQNVSWNSQNLSQNIIPQQQNTRATSKLEPTRTHKPTIVTLMQSLRYWALSNSDTPGFWQGIILCGLQLQDILARHSRYILKCNMPCNSFQTRFGEIWWMWNRRMYLDTQERFFLNSNSF